MRARLILVLGVVAALMLTVGAAPGLASGGQALVYDNQTVYDQGFQDFGAATGNSLTTVRVLPGDLSPFTCVLLNLNRVSFTSDQVTTLSTYLSRGGTIVAIGDFAPFAGAADTTMNALVGSLGGHMSLNANEVDIGFGATTNIDSSPLTAGVSSIQEAAASTLTVSSPASSLVRSRSTGAPIAAVESLDGGRLVLLGDSNMINDVSSDGYTWHNNGTLMHNLCSEPPITVTGQSVSAAEGQSFDGTVATVSGDPGSGPSDYAVSIDWGDGSTSSGSVDSSGNVTGSHTYGDEGSYTIKTTVTDSDASSNTASDTSTTTVGDAPLTAGPMSASGGTEGTPSASASFTFTDANPSAAASDFSATVDWGDGTTSNATVTQNADGSFTVSGGNHTYAEEGADTVAVTVADVGGSQTSASQDVTVADAALSASGTTLNSQPSLTGTVASFSDANPGAPASDYTATVDWGDGTSSNGAISPNASGGFDVSGSHTYAQTGPYTVTVQVADQGGSTADATSQLVIYQFAASDVGSFAIGDQNAAVGSRVVFWGADWAANNSVSSGSAPSSFEGFGSTPLNVSPACGGSYAGGPGNSSSPPATLPAYMGVFVSSSMRQQGRTITGDIAHIAIVKTLSGYAPNPGHQGVGQVVAQVC